MFSIQEILEKTTVQRKQIQHALDNVVFSSDPEKASGWHPEDANIYGTGTHQTPLNLSDQIGIKETLSNLSLAETLMLGTTVNGADKLVATKLYDTLIYAVKQYDICPLISMKVVDKWPGGNLTVTVTKDGTYKARRFASGGKLIEVQPSFVQGTLKPLGYGVPILAGEDLIEDNQFEAVQLFVEDAAKAVGKQATDLALVTLKTATDGDGTLNSTNADSAETKWIGGTPGTNDVLSLTRLIGADEFIPNTLIATNEAWAHSLGSATGTNAWHPLEPREGFQARIGILDISLSNSPSLHAAGDAMGAAMTACKTIVFDRNNALLTGRKRWMEIKNYSDPIADIAGAVVSFRQANVSVYNDSIGVLTEQ